MTSASGSGAVQWCWDQSSVQILYSNLVFMALALCMHTLSYWSKFGSNEGNLTASSSLVCLLRSEWESHVDVMVGCPHTFGYAVHNGAVWFPCAFRSCARLPKESFKKNRFVRESLTTVCSAVCEERRGRARYTKPRASHPRGFASSF